MNKDMKGSVELVKEIIQTNKLFGCEVYISPSFPFLNEISSDLEKTNRLLKVLSEPYKIQSSIQDLQTSPKPSKIPYKTFCGT